MNLQNMRDDLLLSNTEKLAGEERVLLTQILRHLQEIERRKLYSQLGFKSLFDYTVKKLSYSEDQAYRRISAMRLLKEVPEIEEKLNSGTISLTNLTLTQNYFRQEQKTKTLSPQQKLDTLNKIENLSTRQAEKVISQLAAKPLELSPDKIRHINEDYYEITFVADKELLKQIEKIKGLLAHKKTHLNMNELLHELCKIGIEKNSPAAPQKHCNKNRDLSIDGSKSALRRRVWIRDQDRCQKCGSQFALQIDHIVPKAKGGEEHLNNLRLLCRNCNLRAAIEQFGQRKIDSYIQLKKPN